MISKSCSPSPFAVYHLLSALWLGSKTTSRPPHQAPACSRPYRSDICFFPAYPQSLPLPHSMLRRELPGSLPAENHAWHVGRARTHWSTVKETFLRRTFCIFPPGSWSSKAFKARSLLNGPAVLSPVLRRDLEAEGSSGLWLHLVLNPVALEVISLSLRTLSGAWPFSQIINNPRGSCLMVSHSG